MKPEVRYLKGLEIRADADADRPTISGIAPPWNSLSEDLGGFREQFVPGAFAEVLKDSDVRCLANHDPSMILGRQSAGTLEIEEQEKGLFFRAFPEDTPTRAEIIPNIAAGNITGASFSFFVAEDGETWDRSADGLAIRTITKVGGMLDIGPVSFPAYPESTVANRCLERAAEVAAPEHRWQVALLRRRLELAQRRVRV